MSWRSIVRRYVGAGAVLLGLALASCDGGGDDAPPPPPPVDDDDNGGDGDEDYDLTGVWRMKGRSATYRLRQRGRSIQGAYTDPHDPDVHGDIAGAVTGDKVTLYVAVEYASHPADNFTARKEGVIRNKDHMTLVVTGGPKYLGKVQEWYRQ